jgi:3D (Asp-Asp-Asp) domain-containing protein
VLVGPARRVKLHTTGYSFQDNQGGNNAVISCGIIHKTAGGIGTYEDPITVAVPGHTGQGTEIPCGTRIYVPDYGKYFLVEDTGATKYADAAHIDIYVSGEGTSKSSSDRCMDPVTTTNGHPIDAIIDPPPGLPVAAGAITQRDGTCNVAHQNVS